MKEINNFDKLRQFLAEETTFAADNKKSIIWIWVVMRAKDNAEHKERTIKSYHIQSLDDFDYKKDEIIELCKRYHCRAYICVNPKPVLNVLFSLQSIVMENIKNDIIEVLSRYVEIDKEGLDIKVNHADVDANGGPSLYANIPIKGMRHNR